MLVVEWPSVVSVVFRVLLGGVGIRGSRLGDHEGTVGFLTHGEKLKDSFTYSK